MLAYQGGDASAFECLYKRHKDGLFAFLYQSCPQQAVVEEIAQEAWEGVINSAQRYQPSAKFKTWLYQIGRNRIVDFWRRKDNHHEAISADESLPLAGNELENSLASEGAPNLLEEQLMAAIGTLPLEQRDVLLLKEQGFSLREIADITRSEVETVKSRLRYARTRLRELLSEPMNELMSKGA